VIVRNRKYQLDWSRRPERRAQIKEHANEVVAPFSLTRAKIWKLKFKYGLTAEAYLLFLSKQKYRCAVCDLKFTSPSQTQVDHCHATGFIRGILCTGCNHALGNVADRIEVLTKMIEYIRRAENAISNFGITISSSHARGNGRQSKLRKGGDARQPNPERKSTRQPSAVAGDT
jgi:hypothetical protein